MGSEYHCKYYDCVCDINNMIIEDQRKHNLKALFEPQNIKKQFRHGISF